MPSIADLEKRGWQQTPGDVGHVFFIRALAEAGRSDVLHRVYSRDGLGSYGGILKKGLTAMPETWDAMNDGYQSLNHCMLGHVMEWYYGYVAGIRQQPGSVGWKRILIAPVPGPLDQRRGHLRQPGRPHLSAGRCRRQVPARSRGPQGVTAQLIGPDGTARMSRAAATRWSATPHHQRPPSSNPQLCEIAQAIVPSAGPGCTMAKHVPTA